MAVIKARRAARKVRKPAPPGNAEAVAAGPPFDEEGPDTMPVETPGPTPPRSDIEAASGQPDEAGWEDVETGATQSFETRP